MEDGMLKTKKLRIDYFQVMNLSEKEVNDEKFIKEENIDLSGAFKKLADLLPQERQITDKDGELIRVQIIKEKNTKIKQETGEIEYKYWELQILKGRNTSLPGLATSSGQFVPIEINNGDTVSEDISVLYDPQKFIFFIHRKKEGLTPRGIEKFLNKILEKNNFNIILKAIISENDLNKILKEGRYKNLELTILEDKKENNNSLQDILNDNAIFGAHSINIVFSLGRGAKKEDCFNNIKLSALLQKILGKSTTTKARLKPKDSRGEEYDLIKERKHEIINLAYDEKNPISHSRVFAEMEAIYFQKINK